MGLQGLRGVDWQNAYRTSTLRADGKPVDILHEFYLPALRHSVQYDRVAGFFRSSSLAVASQGFSAMSDRDGRIRMIVGSDMEPKDIEAILRGSTKRLEDRMLRELDGHQAKPDEERRGVELLAHLVSRGTLEIKVAFRIDARTKEPLDWNDARDGYVHEKWLLFRDEAGDRLYGTGTLNESKTALVLNAENVDVFCDWWDDRSRARIDEAERTFEDMWTGKTPHLAILSIPEAVRRKLLEIGEQMKIPLEVDGTTDQKPVVPPPSPIEMLRFAMVKDAPRMPNGRFVGMYTAPVEPWPHQEVVIHRLVEDWPYSYLLCDEVGLGKTIEAALAIRSLYLSGWTRRILIAAPAGLVSQWQRELATKALLDFTISTDALYEDDRSIVSTGLMTHRSHVAEMAGAQPYDVALLDEAHYARRQASSFGDQALSAPQYGRLYNLLEKMLRGKTRSLWMATATPMQLDPIEVYDLIRLTRRGGAFHHDPSLMRHYFDAIVNILAAGSSDGDPLGPQDWAFLRRALLMFRDYDPVAWANLKETAIDSRNSPTFHDFVDEKRNPKPYQFPDIIRPLFVGSPLSRVMMRHTRSLLEEYRKRGNLKQKLAIREILPLKRIRFTDLERKCYDELEEYCRELARELSKGKKRTSQQMISFLLSFLRLRFASSFYAIEKTLSRRLRRVQITLAAHGEVFESDDELMEYLSEHVDIEDMLDDDEKFEAKLDTLFKDRTPSDLEWEKAKLTGMLLSLSQLLGISSKMTELLSVIDGRRVSGSDRFQQTVIFTRFFDTLTDIHETLKARIPALRVGVYSGGMTAYHDPTSGRMVGTDRDTVKKMFLQGDVDILLCTDAAAEGLNLQTADLLINYDMGWNPMKIEQRIGRIDRIGQKHDRIFVQNFCYLDSTEAYVYGKLLDRLEKARLVVGKQKYALLPVEPEDFQKLADGTITEEALEQKAIAKIEEQTRLRKNLEMSDKNQYEMYRVMSSRFRATQVPITLEEIQQALVGSEPLRSLGFLQSGAADSTVYQMPHLDEGEPTGLITFSRETFAEGAKGQFGSIGFGSYGDPMFESILGWFDSFGLPDCIQRISIPVDDGRVEVVGFAAACWNKEAGTTSVHLLKRLADLEGLDLDTTHALASDELTKVTRELAALADKEYGPVHKAQTSEGLLGKCSEVHRDFLREVSIALLTDCSEVYHEELFKTIIERVEALYQEDPNKGIRVQMPCAPFRDNSQYLLFDLRVPELGDRLPYKVDSFVFELAKAYSWRVASSFHGRISELTVEQVVSRMRG
jgi:ERCC4-related helicase